MTTNDELREQVAKIKPGDHVEVEYACDREVKPPVSGVVWEDEFGYILLGVCAIRRIKDNEPAYCLHRIVSHTPAKRRIVRGDVIETPEDAERYEVPYGTAFRRVSNSVVLTSTRSVSPIAQWPSGWFPLLCVSALTESGDES